MKNKTPLKKTRAKAAGRGAARTQTCWHEAVIVERHVLQALPNVEQVELGWKERGGKVTGRMAVKIYVAEKKRDLPREEHLPRTARVLVPAGKGTYKVRRLPTDIVWHAPAFFLAGPLPPPGSFLNPVPGGASVGLAGNETGTYTCRVANAQNRVFAMTAGHVIQRFQGRVTAGLQVLQPPLPPPVMPPGASQFFAVTADGFFGNAPNGAGFVDFALMDIDPARSASSTPLDGGRVSAQVIPAAFVVNNRIPMSKFGASTGRTFGAFSTLVASKVIAGITVTNVLEFIGVPGPVIAAGGDSGSLVVSDAQGSQGAIIGILFAATPPAPDAAAGRAYVMPFERLTGLRPV